MSMSTRSGEYVGPVGPGSDSLKDGDGDAAIGVTAGAAAEDGPDVGERRDECETTC